MSAPDRSLADIQAEFADAVRSAGLLIKGPPIMDGQSHRVDVEGDKPGRKSGQYRAHADQWPAGRIVNWKTGENIPWKASEPVRRMDPEEQERFRQEVIRRQETAERERLERHNDAAGRAKRMWDGATALPPEHPYLQAKGISSHGARLRAGEMLVPMRDASGELWNLQRITEDGEKTFLTDGRVTGTHAMLGDPVNGQVIVLAEGFATAATVREMTGLPVAAAFNSGNLLHAARQIEARYPDSPLLIAGDDDRHLPLRTPPLPNVGREKAEAVAREVFGVPIFPPFAPEHRGTDWNDLRSLYGEDAAREAFYAAARERGHRLLSPDAAIVLDALTKEVNRQLPSLSPSARQEIITAAATQLSQREEREGLVELTEEQRLRAAGTRVRERPEEAARTWAEAREAELRAARSLEHFTAIIRNDVFELGRERLAEHYPVVSAEMEAAIRASRASLVREYRREDHEHDEREEVQRVGRQREASR